LGDVKATRLRITSLKFISAVDAGAQGPISNVALIKRAPTGDTFSLTATVAKVDEALGVVFGYAVASTVDGGKSPHIDLQGDAVVGGDVLIKVALGFAEAGAQSDVMHDCIKDGWIPFLMPLNAETKKAFKLAGDVEGIAIGMKPSAETFKRFQSGELAAFSIYGEGIRTPLEETQKRYRFDRIVKEAVMTDEVDGHVHVLDLDDPSCWYQPWYSTSYQTSEGATNGHSHPWTFDTTTGAITIGADSGHTHTVTAVVPPDVLAAFAALDAARDQENAAIAADPTEAICEPVTDEESSGKVQLVVVQARAPIGKSTQGAAAPHVALTTEESMSNTPDLAKQLADLTKSHERLARIAKLSGAHKAHFDTLSADDAEVFLAKSATDRDALCAEVSKRDEEANKVVYVSKSSGDVYKAKDDPRLVEMAKAMDKQAVEIKKAAIRKTAAEVLGGKAPGDDETHDFIVEALGGNEKAMTALKGLVASSTIGKKAPGFNGSDPAAASETDALTALTTGVTKFAKEKNIPNVWTDAMAAFVQTDEGKALKRAYDEAHAAS
jgi:hypothetical protein